LNSVAVPVDHGLATAFPKDALRPRLGRGPTPSTPSFTPTRTPLKIAGATAGSNADHAPASYDDDEVTAWSSDGHAGTGWIAYTLAAPAPVSEVTLKLASWRTKRYPLRVTVDGRTAYTGTTPPSLGYVTLTFKPITGKTVRIELAGKSSASDALDLTEVTGKKNIDSPAKAGTGELKIVEAELYAPATAGSLSSR
jgi:beta-galactosidase